MASGAAPDSGRAPTPVPGESLRRRLLRYWRSRGQYGRLRYWLLFRGLPILLGFGALYVANGFTNGWAAAYELTLGSPPRPAGRRPGSRRPYPCSRGCCHSPVG